MYTTKWFVEIRHGYPIQSSGALCQFRILTSDAWILAIVQQEDIFSSIAIRHEKKMNEAALSQLAQAGLEGSLCQTWSRVWQRNLVNKLPKSPCVCQKNVFCKNHKIKFSCYYTIDWRQMKVMYLVETLCILEGWHFSHPLRFSSSVFTPRSPLAIYVMWKNSSEIFLTQLSHASCAQNGPCLSLFKFFLKKITFLRITQEALHQIARSRHRSRALFMIFLLHQVSREYLFWLWNYVRGPPLELFFGRNNIE
jgi:hypothetical protein